MPLNGIILAVNFRRPDEEFLYAFEDVEKLLALSEERQDTLSEFRYLKENISWFKKKRDTKTLSLNLATRLSQKIPTKKYRKGFPRPMSLWPRSHSPLGGKPSDRNQTLKSQQARGETPAPAGEKETAQLFDKPKELDIRLHESVRIMLDWIDLLGEGQASQKNPSSLVREEA